MLLFGIVYWIFKPLLVLSRKFQSNPLFVHDLLYRLLLFYTAANGIEEPCPTAENKAAKLKKKQKKQVDVQPEDSTAETTPRKKKKNKRKLGDATEPPGKLVANHECL